MVIADPGQELVRIVARSGDDPSPADAAAALLLRRRFGVSLPPPFVRLAEGGAPPPVRAAEPIDVPALGAVRWRSTSRGYRGMVPDEVLASETPSPPLGWWRDQVTGAARPGAGHAVMVAGGRGSVVALCWLGPTQPWGHEVRRPTETSDDVDLGEVARFGVDPLAWGHGIGRALLAAAEARLVALGFGHAVLWVMEANVAAQAFWEACGWRPDGGRQTVHAGRGVQVCEVRYRRALGPGRSSFWSGR
ncbi:MAG: GNAT family N-acetyltransferase [Actinobacteria bacterium]|nr:GNAT family N-acetyltransferase [Actinomycetota bacterium]